MLHPDFLRLATSAAEVDSLAREFAHSVIVFAPDQPELIVPCANRATARYDFEGLPFASASEWRSIAMARFTSH